MDRSEKILVGYDGSVFADAALKDLAQAGLPKRGTVIVLSAADVFLPKGSEIKMPALLKKSVQMARQTAKEHVKQAAALAGKAAKAIKEILPGWRVKSEACADSPAWALVKKADQWKPDLIVVGAHGHSKLGRFLGSVSQMVLTHTAQSVRVARTKTGQSSEKLRIVVGMDGSSDAAAAVNIVAERAWPANTEVILISVVDPKFSAFMKYLTPSEIRWILEQADDERAAAGRLLETYAKKLREKGLVVTCLVEAGDPKRVLVDEAEKWGADCVFIGARGLSEMKRFLIGGVSSAVAARAHCSVEVVRSRTAK